ncbi:hypothetical protein J7481_23700, partial [Labrenzia sp. R4_2]|uniref:hypothetical protein n=1 Tax=Labrenzia sp. R4_2 TaxID=2821107 RepID=UPI001ADA65B9
MPVAIRMLRLSLRALVGAVPIAGKPVKRGYKRNKSLVAGGKVVQETGQFDERCLGRKPFGRGSESQPCQHSPEGRDPRAERGAGGVRAGRGRA